MRVEHSITVPRPVDEVWAFVGDYANDPRFIDAVTKVELLFDGAPSVGARMRRSMRLPVVNKDVETEVEIVRVDPLRAIAFRATGLGLSFVETRELERVGPSSTRITFRLEGDPGGAVKLGERVMAWQAKRAMTSDLDALSRALAR